MNTKQTTKPEKNKIANLVFKIAKEWEYPPCSSDTSPIQDNLIPDAKLAYQLMQTCRSIDHD